MCIRFTTNDIAAIGRVTSGVKGINLNDGDEVICGFPIVEGKKEIAIIGKNGYGKKTDLTEFNVQGRGGKGVKLGAEIAGAVLIGPEDNLLLIGKPNSICIEGNDLPVQGKSTLGVKLAQNEIKSVVSV